MATCWGDDSLDQLHSPFDPMIELSARGSATCGVYRSGPLGCWGRNAALGSPPAGSFAHVALGTTHACAIHADGTLACWGQDTVGETRPPSGHFTAVAVGEGFSCAVRDDGELVCWGAQTRGG